MKKGLRAIFILVILSGLMIPLAIPISAAPVTVTYPNAHLYSMLLDDSWSLEENPVWDLTQGDLRLSYTIDLSKLNNRTVDSTILYDTAYVGLEDDTGEHHYGLMASSNPSVAAGGPNHQHCLQTEMDPSIPVESDESNYNVLANHQNTILDPPIGSDNSSGIWFDSEENPYNIVIIFHAINTTQGAMFATVNGVPQGFAPDYAEAGLSFTGDMTNMKLHARLMDRAWDPDSVWSICDVTNISATQYTTPQPQLLKGWLNGLKKGWDGSLFPPGWTKSGK